MPAVTRIARKRTAADTRVRITSPLVGNRGCVVFLSSSNPQETTVSSRYHGRPVRCRLDVQRLGPRFWSRSAAVVTLAGTLALIAGGVAGGAVTDTHLVGTATTVAVTIRDSGVLFSPTVVPSGSVTFVVVNRGKAARDF